MTEKYALHKSVITGHYIIFGMGKTNEKDIARPDIKVNTLTADNSDY